MAKHNLPARCWSCGAKHDAASNVDGEGIPEPGDLTICIRCGEWSVIGDDLALRKPTDAEFADIAESDDCRRARAAWVQVVERDGGVRLNPILTESGRG